MKRSIQTTLEVKLAKFLISTLCFFFLTVLFVITFQYFSVAFRNANSSPDYFGSLKSLACKDSQNPERLEIREKSLFTFFSFD
jgi:hypothetical protein